MKIKNKYWVILLAISVIIIFGYQSSFSAEVTKTSSPKSSSFAQFLKNLANKAGLSNLPQHIKDIVKKMDFSTRVETEYDSNIFLAEDNENSDIINTLTQKVSLKLPQEPFYWQVDYTGNLHYYTQEGDTLHDHLADFLLSYRPFEKISFGLGNYFKKMTLRKISAVFGDRLLSRGYKEDTPYFELKLEPLKKLTIDSIWQYYYLDSDAQADDYIDRGDNISRIAFNYEFSPELSGFLGYRYLDAHFPHLITKDAELSRVFYGITKKFPNLCNVSMEVGHENGSLSYRDDANIDAKLILNTSFSVYTMLSLSYGYNSRVPSARSEYSQYFVNSINLSLTHLLNPKTTLLVNLGLEREKFDSSDALSPNPAVNKKTHIISLDSTLRRSLNEWLSLDLAYAYTKRNTDFAAEGYTDNKVSLSLTANY